jgi:hypothetical protein
MKLSGLIKFSMGIAMAAATSTAWAQGWTPINPSIDSRIVYVSSSGNDANNGLSPSSPKRTIAAGHALLRNGYPDHLLLKKGDIFYEPVSWSRSGRSPSEPAVLSSYGSGPRPVIRTGSTHGIHFGYSSTLNNVAVVGLHLHSHTWAGQLPPGQDPSGILLIRPGDSFLVEDCYIQGYGNSVIIQGYPGVRTNTKIRRNVLVDPIRLDPNNGSTNIFMHEYDGVLIEENVMDLSYAAEASGSMLSHSIYLAENNPSGGVVVRNNIAHNGGRTNFNIRPGGLIENNLSIRGAQGITVGISYAQDYCTATIRNNVIIESRNNQNGQSLGLGVVLNKVQSADVDGNILCHSTDGDYGTAISTSSQNRGSTIRNNIVYHWKSRTPPGWGDETVRISGTPEGHISVTGNQLQQGSNAKMIVLGSATTPSGLVSFGGNTYHSARAASAWFQPNDNQSLGFSGWSSMMGEPGSQAWQLNYPDPGRTIGSYNATLGRPGTTLDFLTQARMQSRDNWRPAYTAAVVNNYIRAGFGVGPISFCRPDINQDGYLNVADFTAFLNAFSMQSTIADYNEDGLLNMADFSAYLYGFSQGCQ